MANGQPQNSADENLPGVSELRLFEEEDFAKNPKFAYYYALHVIEDRWIEGETTIAKFPCYTYW